MRATLFLAHGSRYWNSPGPVQFSWMIPKMSKFALVIYNLTTSSLAWFMDLTFQVPMQYCSLQHKTLLPSPVISTTGCCFFLESVSSFFLELFLYPSLVAYWAPTDLGNSSFSVLSFLFFILFTAFWRQDIEVVCHSLLQWTMFDRTLYHDPSILGGPTHNGS